MSYHIIVTLIDQGTSIDACLSQSCVGHGADTRYLFPRTARLPYMGIMAKRIRYTHMMEYGEAIKLFKAHVATSEVLFCFGG
jgi:hypothetical protein